MKIVKMNRKSIQQWVVHPYFLCPKYVVRLLGDMTNPLHFVDKRLIQHKAIFGLGISSWFNWFEVDDCHSTYWLLLSVKQWSSWGTDSISKICPFFKFQQIDDGMMTGCFWLQKATESTKWYCPDLANHIVMNMRGISKVTVYALYLPTGCFHRNNSFHFTTLSQKEWVGTPWQSWAHSFLNNSTFKVGRILSYWLSSMHSVHFSPVSLTINSHNESLYQLWIKISPTFKTLC